MARDGEGAQITSPRGHPSNFRATPSPPPVPDKKQGKGQSKSAFDLGITLDARIDQDE